MSHPSIRIATLIAFAVALASGPPTATAALAAGAVLVTLVHGRSASNALLRLLKRARWLLLLVIAFNAWGTPGDALWEGAPAWTPSSAGLELALHRGATLVAMLTAVSLLITTTTAEALVAGIAWFAVPLRIPGAGPERLAARLADTLERLGATERELREVARTDGWRDALARTLVGIERRAAAALPRSIPAIGAPRASAWSWPALTLVLAALLARD